jgi:uncharacterized membrane protein
MHLDLKDLAERIRGALWFDPLVGAAVGVGLAALSLAGPAIDPFIALPDLGAGAAGSLLQLIGGGMLTVITVTLSVMLVVVGSVGSNASPRAAPALIADPVAHHALAVFVGAFAFAVTGIVLLAVAVEGPTGRGLMFVIGILVLAYALATLVAWIHHAADSLRLASVIARLHDVAVDAVAAWREDPFCGAAPAPATASTGEAMTLERTGWLRRVDVAAIAAAAERSGAVVTLALRPGAFVHPGVTVAYVAGAPADARSRRAIAEAFAVGTDRSHAQDPLLGLDLLGEVARRALSPGINDPGTALECLNYIEDLLLRAVAAPAPEAGPGCAHVRMPAIPVERFIAAALPGIARDGQDEPDVMARIRTVLAAVAARGTESAAAAARAAAASLLHPARS